MEKAFKYDVAISFAEEDRNAALALSLALELQGFKKVYYYPDKQGDGWGEELEKKLTRVYRDEARFAVVLLSKNYFEPAKVHTWTEMRAIDARMKMNKDFVYMYPVQLYGDASLKAYPAFEKLKCLDWNYDPKRIALHLDNRLGKKLSNDKKYSGTGNIIYSTGDQSTFIVGGRLNNFTQTIIKGDGQQ